MTRLQATVALLQAWLDYAPHPETWTGELQRRSVSAKSKPKDLGYVACDQCGGDGCKACWWKGRFIGDPYLAERGLVLHSLTSFARFVNCSTCGGWGRLAANPNVRPREHGNGVEPAHPICDECNGTGKVPGLSGGMIRFHEEANGREPSHGDATLDALARNDERRESVPIYRDHLLPALHGLKEFDRQGHFLVQWVWILGAQSPLSLPAKGTVRLINGTRAIEAALPDRFEKQLPGEIRAQHDHQQAMRSRSNGWAQAKGRGVNGKQFVRDAEVQKLWATGSWTQAQLAEKFGVNQSAISKIVNK